MVENNRYRNSEYNNRPTSYTFNHNANIYRGNIVMLDDFG